MDTFLFAAILSVVFVSDTRLLFCQHKRIKTRFDITLKTYCWVFHILLSLGELKWIGYVA